MPLIWRPLNKKCKVSKRSLCYGGTNATLLRKRSENLTVQRQVCVCGLCMCQTSKTLTLLFVQKILTKLPCRSIILRLLDWRHSFLNGKLYWTNLINGMECGYKKLLMRYIDIYVTSNHCFMIPVFIFVINFFLILKKVIFYKYCALSLMIIFLPS